MPGEEYPYQEEWEKYRERNALGCLAVPLIIGLVPLYRHFSPQLPEYLSGIIFVLFLAYIFVYLVFLDKGGWKCPRCAEAFDYRKRIKPTKKCINCGLPIYYGSTFFYDHWGTEQGNELAEKVKREKL